MAIFSRQLFKKFFFLIFFFIVTPLQESDRQNKLILLFIQQDVYVYFKKTTKNCSWVPSKALKMINVRPYPLMTQICGSRPQWVNQSKVDFQKPLKTPLIIIIWLIIQVEMIKTPPSLPSQPCLTHWPLVKL